MNSMLFLDLEQIKAMLENTSGVSFVKDYQNKDESYILDNFAVFNLMNAAFKMGVEYGIKESN